MFDLLKTISQHVEVRSANGWGTRNGLEAPPKYFSNQRRSCFNRTLSSTVSSTTQGSMFHKETTSRLCCCLIGFAPNKTFCALCTPFHDIPLPPFPLCFQSCRPPGTDVLEAWHGVMGLVAARLADPVVLRCTHVYDTPRASMGPKIIPIHSSNVKCNKHPF